MPRPTSLLIGLLAATLLGACGSFGEDDVRSALDDLPYDVEYFEVARPEGAEEVIAGRATDERGMSIQFAVTIVGSDAADPQRVRAAKPPGGGNGLDYSADGTTYFFRSNGYPHYFPEDSVAEAKRRQAMNVDLDLAICEAAFDDATCI